MVLITVSLDCFSPETLFGQQRSTVNGPPPRRDRAAGWQSKRPCAGVARRNLAALPGRKMGPGPRMLRTECAFAFACPAA